jgi:CRP/FNR family transcriptional regulator, nitrogen oxide reductase regulator
MNSAPSMSATRPPPHGGVAGAQFLKGIPSHSRKLILEAALYRTVPAKATIIQGGGKATHMFLLASGSARYYRVTGQGKELLLRWLVPGDVFGLASLLSNPPPYMGSVQVTEESEVYVWKHERLCELAGAYPQLVENALRIALAYLAGYADRHANLLTQKAEQRLAHSLVHLGHHAGRHHSGVVQVDVTNEQLGNLSDVSMFTATRLLKKWERKGAIAKKRNKILILAPEKLDLD